jgi:hypothetical protein
VQCSVLLPQDCTDLLLASGVPDRNAVLRSTFVVVATLGVHLGDLFG